MDPFIDTAILAEQTIKNAARLRDTTLKALAQKAQWRISQTMPPDFELELDVYSADVPLLDIFALPDAGNFMTFRIQLPANQANPYVIYRLLVHVALDGPVERVAGDGIDPSKDVLLYDNVTDELEGRIELK